MPKPYRNHRGLTLVEVLVVLAIIAVLSAVAVPGMIRLGVLSRDELARSGREVSTMLRAARVYAATYRVNTALVYLLDNYTDPAIDPDNDAPLAEPIVDSRENIGIRRVITHIAIFYQLPREAAPFDGRFVPVNDERGLFRPLPRDTAVLLAAPSEAVPGIEDIYYLDERPRANYARFTNPEDPDADPGTEGQPAVFRIRELGMKVVPVYMDLFGPFAPPGAEFDFFRSYEVPMLAHVFTPGGSLDLQTDRYNQQDPESTPAVVPEVLTLLVGLRPDVDVEDRFWTSTDGSDPEDIRNLRRVPIKISKSSGRIVVERSVNGD